MSASDSSRFFPGDSEMADRMRSFDWTQTPLGIPARWSRNLHTSVRIMLTSRHPMFVWWGEALITLYNDGYAEFLHAKHPDALGRPASAVWSEIWDDLGPRAEFARRQNAGTYDEALPYVMRRKGYAEETYVTSAYTPIPDDDGGVGGILCPVTEDTQRIVGARRLTLLRELATRTAGARTPLDACRLAADALATDQHDVPFALIYARGAGELTATLAGSCGLTPVDPTAPNGIREIPAIWLETPTLNLRSALVSDLSPVLGRLPIVHDRFRPAQAVIVPVLMPDGRPHESGMLIVGLNPLRQYDGGYERFVDLVGGAISTAVTNTPITERERPQGVTSQPRPVGDPAAIRDYVRNAEHREATLRGELEDARQTHDLLEGRVEARTRELHQVLGRVVNAQEAERKRIARDVHDQLGQQMTALRFNLDALVSSGGPKDDKDERVRRVQALCEELDRSIDFLTWSLRPAALDHFGLSAALSDLVHGWSARFRITAEYQATGEAAWRLPPDAEANVYRIVQEALHNVYKHANASHVSVSLEHLRDRIVLTVEDDGCGFDVTAADDLGGAGLGIVGMRERAALAGGSLEIESTAGNGTTIFLRMRI